MRTKAQIQRAAKQLYRLCLVDGLLDESRVRQAVQLIIDDKRRGSIELVSHFQRLVRLYSEAHTASVQTAAPLPADLKASVQARLHDLYGPGIDAQFALKPALIGGMRVKVGSDVFDGSVRSELDLLEKSI
jgi:F-type H+-transporting ATPase subunit delta